MITFLIILSVCLPILALLFGPTDGEAKFFLFAWTIFLIIDLWCLGGIIWVAHHFIVKYW